MYRSLFLLLFLFGCNKDQLLIQNTKNQNFAGDYKYSVSIEKMVNFPQNRNGFKNIESFFSAIRIDKNDPDFLWISGLHGLDQCFHANLDGDNFVIDKTETAMTLESLGFENTIISGPETHATIYGTGKANDIVTYYIEMNDILLFKCTGNRIQNDEMGYQANNYLKVCE